MTKSEAQVLILACDLDPVEAAIKHALDLNDGAIEDHEDFFHAVFMVLTELHSLLGWPPPSPDDLRRDLREWLVDEGRRAA